MIAAPQWSTSRTFRTCRSATSSSRQGTTAFTRGFPIGRVETAERGTGLYKTIKVRPVVDFSNVEEVLSLCSPLRCRRRRQGRKGDEDGDRLRHDRGCSRCRRRSRASRSAARLRIDLVLVAVAYAALAFGPVVGLFAGTLGGLAQDALSAQIIGVSGLAKTLVGFVSGVVGSQFIVSGRFPGSSYFWAPPCCIPCVSGGSTRCCPSWRPIRASRRPGSGSDPGRGILAGVGERGYRPAGLPGGRMAAGRCCSRRMRYRG